MDIQKLSYHLASVVRLYLTELQNINEFLDDVNKFFQETYTWEEKKDSPLYKMFQSINETMLGSRNNQLFKMIIVSCISIFEAFNKDFFKVLYILRPENMKSKKKLDLNYEELVEFNSIEELYKNLASKKVDQFGRMSIDNLVEELEDKQNILEIRYPFEYWETLREKYYRRNIIVHNQGKISKDYIDKITGYTEKDIDIELELTIEYVRDCLSNVWDYIEFVYEIIRKKNKIDISIEKITEFDMPFSFVFDMDPRDEKWKIFEKKMNQLPIL